MGLGMKLEVFLSSDELSRHLRDLVPRLKKAKHKVKVHNVFGPFDAMKALSLGIKNYPAVYVKDTGEIKEGNDALLFVLELLGVPVSAKPVEEELKKKVEAGEVKVAKEEAPIPVAPQPSAAAVEQAKPQAAPVVVEAKPKKRRLFGRRREEKPAAPLAAGGREPEYYAAVAEALLSDGAYAGFASANSLDELERKLGVRQEEGIVVLDVQVKMGREWRRGILVYDNGKLVYARLEGFESRSIDDIVRALRGEAKRITSMVYKRR